MATSRVTERVLLVSLALIGAGIIGAVLVVSRSFRPVADDYVFAANALDVGPIRATYDMFLNWHGGVTQMLYDHTVGLVIAVTPWDWGYFLLTAGYLLMVTLVFAYLWDWILGGWRFAVVSLSLFATGVWVISLGHLTGDDTARLYLQFSWFSGATRGILSWVVLVIVVRFLRIGGLTRRHLLWVAAVVGLLVGLWGLAESLALGVACLLAAALAARGRLAASVRELLVLAGGLLLGGLINYVSPGSRERSELFDPGTVEDIARRIVANLEQEWLLTVGNLSYWLAVPVFAGVGVGWAAAGLRRSRRAVGPMAGPHPDPLGDSTSQTAQWWESVARRSLTLAGILGALVLIQLPAIAVGAAFSYFAEWHVYGVICQLICLSMLVGLAGGHRLVRLGVGHVFGLGHTALVLAGFLLVSGAVLKGLNASTQDRLAVWEAGGNATMGDMGDRTEGSWVNEYWLKLQRLRGS